LRTHLRGSTEILRALSGMQINGGSSTVPDGFSVEKLRSPGAGRGETLEGSGIEKGGVAGAS